jgi:hypothetical protein
VDLFNNRYQLKGPTVVFGGVMVSVFAVGPKVRGLNPGRGDGFLRAIKIRSTSSFGGEVKPEAPCRKILRNVKKPFQVWKKVGYFVR